MSEDIETLAAIVSAALALREACVATYPASSVRHRAEHEARRVLFAALERHFPGK